MLSFFSFCYNYFDFFSQSLNSVGVDDVGTGVGVAQLYVCHVHHEKTKFIKHTGCDAKAVVSTANNSRKYSQK